MTIAKITQATENTMKPKFTAYGFDFLNTSKVNDFLQQIFRDALIRVSNELLKKYCPKMKWHERITAIQEIDPLISKKRIENIIYSK